MFDAESHSFVICAYRESPYLEECVRSLLNQTVRTNILMTTSTPNEHIRGIAEKYQIPLCINRGESGIAGDWNFALSAAETPLVTLAHQDDLYEPEYAEVMLKEMNRARNPILFSCNYAELRGDSRVTSSRLLNIKKILRVPMRMFPGRMWARRMSLAFGDSICCPSVTYVRGIMEDHPFRKGFRSDLDWEKWEELSRLKGSFCYSNQILMCHRIHGDSETTHVIREYSRSEEDYQIFRKFWPDRIARRLTRLYAGSEKSNEIQDS